MEWITTSTIVSNLRDFQNRAAWEQLAERFRRPLLRFVERLGLSPAEADDVLQEALLAFAQAVRSGAYQPERGRLSRYLFGITYRQALALRRARGRGAAGRAGELPTELADEQTASGTWDEEWERAMLEQCLEQVRTETDELNFAAFNLVVAGDKTPAEAAEALGIPVKQVYNAKHRILQRVRELREQFEDGRGAES